MNELISRNQMTAEELVIRENAPLKPFDFVGSDGKNHVFFTCGEITGYISPAALDALHAGAKIEDLQYCESSKDGGMTFVPCLMVKGTSHQPFAVLGLELLR